MYQKYIYGELAYEWTEVISKVEGKGKDKFVTVDCLDKDGKTESKEVYLTVEGKLLLRSGGDLRRRGDSADECVEIQLANMEEVYGETLREQKTDRSFHINPPRRLTIPAGSFEAMQVTGARSSSAASAGSLIVPFTESHWYASGVGLVRSTATASGRSSTAFIPIEVILKSFTPGKE